MISTRTGLIRRNESEERRTEDNSRRQRKKRSQQIKTQKKLNFDSFTGFSFSTAKCSRFRRSKIYSSACAEHRTSVT